MAVLVTCNTRVSRVTCDVSRVPADLCGQCDEPGDVAGAGAVAGDPGVGGVEAGADPAPPHLHPVHHAPLLLRQDLRQDVLNIRSPQFVSIIEHCETIHDRLATLHTEPFTVISSLLYYYY